MIDIPAAAAVDDNDVDKIQNWFAYLPAKCDVNFMVTESAKERDRVALSISERYTTGWLNTMKWICQLSIINHMHHASACIWPSSDARCENSAMAPKSQSKFCF